VPRRHTEQREDRGLPEPEEKAVEARLPQNHISLMATALARRICSYFNNIFPSERRKKVCRIS
jgi:hypothetical protein